MEGDLYLGSIHMGKVKKGYWLFSIFQEEREGEFTKGAEASGHSAIGYLARCSENWFDERGNKISGYIYFKPTNY